MSILVIGVVLLITISVIYGLQRQTVAIGPASEPSRRKQERANAISRFEGMFIEPGPDCCQAVRTVSDITFKRGEHVNLPLSGCNRVNCQCRKVPIVDRRIRGRRSGIDRREEIRFTSEPDDRRKNSGRRLEDRAWVGGHAH